MKQNLQDITQPKSKIQNKLIFVFLFAAVILFLGIRPVYAQHDFGAGIVIGDPTGFSFKYDLNSINSIDAALAWSDHINILLQGTYLWHKPKLFFMDSYPVDLFFGVGARLRDRDEHKYRDKDEDGFQLGIRGPVGLRFMFNDPRIEIFAEISAVMNFIPDTDFDIDAGIGARYYF